MKNISLVSRIAFSRIGNLMKLAEERTLDGSPRSKVLARRYVELARSIGSHYKVSIPKSLKYRMCRKCGNFLIPGVNCSVRLASVHGYIAYRCECGKERHVLYKRAR